MKHVGTGGSSVGACADAAAAGSESGSANNRSAVSNPLPGSVFTNQTRCTIVRVAQELNRSLRFARRINSAPSMPTRSANPASVFSSNACDDTSSTRRAERAPLGQRTPSGTVCRLKRPSHLAARESGSVERARAPPFTATELEHTRLPLPACRHGTGAHASPSLPSVSCSRRLRTSPPRVASLRR